MAIVDEVEDTGHAHHEVNLIGTIFNIGLTSLERSIIESEGYDPEECLQCEDNCDDLIDLADGLGVVGHWVEEWVVHGEYDHTQEDAEVDGVFKPLIEGPLKEQHRFLKFQQAFQQLLCPLIAVQEFAESLVIFFNVFNNSIGPQGLTIRIMLSIDL